jgi:hypothetical protein
MEARLIVKGRSLTAIMDPILALDPTPFKDANGIKLLIHKAL